MKKYILTLILLLPLLARADFTTLSTEKVQAKIAQGVTVIDIRRDEEFKQYGIIPKSHKLTFFNKKGRYNAPKWLKSFAKIVPNKDTPFILVCAHANRTKILGRFLSEQGYKNVSELAGGINYGWIDKGLSTVKTAGKDGKNKPWYKFW
ncbi:MAG: rhodanese-like domain-containing protein [Candidatus Thioglobus sp.]|nr:MAG: rhodanese-like domain-containing protein [Candidatus Thioglobus sp.]